MRKSCVVDESIDNLQQEHQSVTKSRDVRFMSSKFHVRLPAFVKTSFRDVTQKSVINVKSDISKTIR